MIDEYRVPNGRGADGVQGAIDAVIGNSWTRVPDADALGVGIAGLVDFAGHMRYGPNLPEVLVLPVREHMEQLSALPVSVDNDANTAGYGELHFGAARARVTRCSVTLGTGIGGAIIANGEIYRGANGFAAEIGHFTLDRSGPCAHAVSVGTGRPWRRVPRSAGWARSWWPVDAARRSRRPPPVHPSPACTSARDGPCGRRRRACNCSTRSPTTSRSGWPRLSNILDPELIVIGGGLVGLGALLFTLLDAAFAVHLEGTAYRNDIRVGARGARRARGCHRCRGAGCCSSSRERAPRPHAAVVPTNRRRAARNRVRGR